MTEVKEHVLRQLRRIPVKNSMCSPSGSESPHRESSRAVEASREVAPPELVIVPKVPTSKMVERGQMLPTSLTLTQCYELTRELWAAMVEAAPTPEAPLFHLEHVGTRLQMRVDAITERGGETVGISLGFAREIVQAISRFAPSVSDGSREAGETEGLDPKDDSAAASAETPIHPSPSGEVEKVIETAAQAAYEHPSWGHKQPWKSNPWARKSWLACMRDVLAPLLTTYAEDHERLRATVETLQFGERMHNERAEAAQAEIERLRAERDLLRAETDAKTQTISAMQDRVDWAYKQKEAAEAGHRMQTKATLAFREDWLASQAQAEEMIKALEPFEHYEDWPERAPHEMTGVRLSFGELRKILAARTALMKGGE